MYSQLQDKLESREKEARKQKQKVMEKFKDQLKSIKEIDEHATYEAVCRPDPMSPCVLRPFSLSLDSMAVRALNHPSSPL